MPFIKINRYYLLVIFVCISCSATEKGTNLNVKTESGQIAVTSPGTYTVTYNGQVSIYNNVSTFLIFNNKPYFALADGRILKWTQLISNNAYNLQKIHDKLYFLKRYGERDELVNVSLVIIDEKDKMREAELKYSDGRSVLTEEYGLVDDRFIVENIGPTPGFCVADKNGKVNVDKCYSW
jgi:hypothetical protein